MSLLTKRHRNCDHGKTIRWIKNGCVGFNSKSFRGWHPVEMTLDIAVQIQTCFNLVNCKDRKDVDTVENFVFKEKTVLKKIAFSFFSNHFLKPLWSSTWWQNLLFIKFLLSMAVGRAVSHFLSSIPSHLSSSSAPCTPFFCHHHHQVGFCLHRLAPPPHTNQS